MAETETTSGVCEAILAVQEVDEFKAVINEIWPAGAAMQQEPVSAAFPVTTKTLVWAPARSGEPKGMLLAWAKGAAALGADVRVVIVLNGTGSERAAGELRQDSPPGVQVHALPGAASIGRAQQFVTHQFLRSDAQILARIDPDGQFRLSDLTDLCRRLVPGGPDVIVAQRDEASVSGYVRFLGNVILRLAAMHRGLVDPNSGFYVMNRRAAAALCQVPLPKYPEPRMLTWLKGMSMEVSSVVAPTLPRQSGTSSIKGVARAAAVFLSSLLELLSCDRV